MDQAAVLIIADDAEFARAVTSRWQGEKSVPVFTLMSGDLCPGISATAFDIALAGALRPGVLPSVLTILESTGKPVLFVAPDTHVAETVRETHTRTSIVRLQEGWLDGLILVASEMLRSSQANARARRAEQASAASEAQAILGRYMLDMRHTLNNALTSVLGNSELLLSEPGVLSAQAREQLETIRSMAFRMHEILQRFSSLEAELRYLENHSPYQVKTQAAGAGE